MTSLRSHSLKSSTAAWRIEVFSPHSQGDGLQLEYEMKLTNGQSFWTQHFSADEFGKSDRREGIAATNGRWDEPRALSTANKRCWTEQVTIMKEWLNNLMMMGQLMCRMELLNELLHPQWCSLYPVYQYPQFFSASLSSLFLLHIVWTSTYYFIHNGFCFYVSFTLFFPSQLCRNLGDRHHIFGHLLHGLPPLLLLCL